MGDLLPGVPSLPGDETTWQDFVEQFEALKKGNIPLSLTNWDSSTTKPEVSAGSLIEIAGAVYLFDSDEGITNDSGLTVARYMWSSDRMVPVTQNHIL